MLIVIVLASFYVHHAMKQQYEMGYAQAASEYTTRQRLAEQAAHARESELNRQLQKAQNAATLRDQQIQTLSAAVSTASDRLRDTTRAIRNSLLTASIDAVRKAADASLTVFEECAGKYTEMAGNATGHASDVETLEDAWPKYVDGTDISLKPVDKN